MKGSGKVKERQWKGSGKAARRQWKVKDRAEIPADAPGAPMSLPVEFACGPMNAKRFLPAAERNGSAAAVFLSRTMDSVAARSATSRDLALSIWSTPYEMYGCADTSG